MEQEGNCSLFSVKLTLLYQDHQDVFSFSYINISTHVFHGTPTLKDVGREMERDVEMDLLEQTLLENATCLSAFWRITMQTRILRF